MSVEQRVIEIVCEHRAGNAAAARERFAQALPLMVFESQPGIALALRKENLRRRGAIRHATVRQPAPTLDATTLAELARVMGGGDGGRKSSADSR